MPSETVTLEQLERLDERGVERELPNLDAEGLELLVRRANREYWDENQPSLSDPLYDRLVSALRELQPDSPLLESLGAARPSGEALTTDDAIELPPEERLGRGVLHLSPMLSLDKCYDRDDLYAWAEKFEGDIFVMPKMDGVACSLRYDANGGLALAATRGSGTEGEDITINTLEIEDIPNQLPAGHGDVEVRGEIFMRLSVFEDYRADYSNPRNLTAGAIKNKNAAKSRAYRLSFFPYALGGDSPATEDEKFALLAQLGFVTQARLVPRGELQAAFEDWSKRRPDLDFEIDGVVYRASSIAEQQRLGATAHHPRWSIAYKFQGDTGRTRVKEIEWSVSRTGRVTPVALLEPIELSGAMISRASLHNLSRFADLGLRLESVVEVTRRGGVIPMVERMVEFEPDAPLFERPNQCPACGSELEVSKDREAEFLQCTRPEACGVARLGELQHFVKVADIDGFGPKVITKAVDAGLLSEPADFYRLTVEQLAAFDRLGRRSAQNLVDEVQAHRELALPTFLQALGIDHLGKQYALLMADNFGTLDRVRTAAREELLDIHGIQDAIANSIVDGLQRRGPMIDALLAAGVSVPAHEIVVQEAQGGPLEGKSFLFTGTLEHMNRKSAQAKVEAAGGQSANSVTKTLSYLVVGGGRDKKSSKEKKADKLIESGAPLQVISEDDFLAMVGEPGDA